VQDNRLEAEVVGWARNRQAWSVERKVIIGSPTEDETWEELEEYISQTFEHVDGHRLPILKVGVDSGFRAQEVYTFCRKFDQRRVVPLKGQDDLPQIFSKPRAVSMKENGKTLRRGIQLWKVGTNIIKTELYGDLGKNPPEKMDDGFPTGFRHFPNYEMEYFEQLVAEKRVITKNRKGYTIVEWRKERERNETLDLWVYNRALASMVGIDRMSEEQWKKLEENIGVVKNLKRPENGKNVPKPSSKQRRPRDNEFWDN
jgi:phage terminase large subunit GpA-like protein